MKAIKSVLANRKMFRGGGLVPSRNEMVDLNAPSGILSSSMPLIDAVESDALSAEGGTALMSQGGVARFASGGSNTDAWQDIDRVRQARAAYESGIISRADLQAVMDAVLQKHGGVRNLYAKLSPEQKKDPVVQEEAFQLRPAPEVPDAPIPAPPSSEGLLPLDVSAASEFDTSAAVPLDMGLNPNVPPELQSYLAESGMRPVLKRQIANMPQPVAPPPVDQPAVLTPIGPPPQIIAPEIQEAPSAMFEGDIAPNQGIVSATPPPELQREERRPSGLLPSSAVSGIGDTIAENLMVEKPEPVIEEAAAPEELSTLERILAEDARIQREPGFTDAGDSWIQPNWSPGKALIEKFTGPSVIAQRRSAASGLDPVEEAPSEADIAAAEQFPTVESLTEVEDTTEEVEDATEEVTVETPPSSKEAADAQEVKTELNQSELVTALTLQQKLVANREVDLDLGRPGTLERVANEQRSDTFVDAIVNAANANKQEDLNSKMKTYIDEFKSAMPDYEGKSEWEQGLDIVKMGMAIAAGESPNAITNIAKGVLATIDNFTSDEKERRDYKRQIDFAAANYSLDSLAKDKANAEADDRQLFLFYDTSKATTDNPWGDSIYISRAEILKNGGEMPEGLKSENYVLKSIAEIGYVNRAILKRTQDLEDADVVGYKEGEDLRGRLDTAQNAFVSSEVGINLINGVITKVAADDITGGVNAAQELLGRAMKFAGFEPDKKYTDIEQARKDVRRAFQLLIPISLGEAQTANSISNRDVQFLADAYIDNAFLNDGVLDFSTTGKKAIVTALQAASKKFKDEQVNALAEYKSILGTISGTTGRYGEASYEPQIRRLAPYAERVEAEQAGTPIPVGASPYTYELDPDSGIMRPKGVEGSAFEGQFFTPNAANIAKIWANWGS